MTLIATGSPCSRWTPCQTTPIPPLPRGACSSNGPRRIVIPGSCSGGADRSLQALDPLAQLVVLLAELLDLPAERPNRLFRALAGADPSHRLVRVAARPTVRRGPVHVREAREGARI